MGKSLVGLGHLVGILALLAGAALAVHSVHDLASQSLSHQLFAAVAAIGGQPTQTQGLTALRAYLHGYLISGAADTASLDLQNGHDVLHRQLKSLQRVLAGPKSSTAVGKEWFNDVSFVGDSLTQGMQLYEEGMQNAMFCAYKGVGPNVIVNGTTCKRADGVAEVPLEALTAQQPRAIYVLLGTNVLGRDTDYSSFLTYYRLMLDMLSQTLPNAKIYVQSITPVRPEVCQKSGHEGLNRDRLCQINNELADIALEKN